MGWTGRERDLLHYYKRFRVRGGREAHILRNLIIQLLDTIFYYSLTTRVPTTLFPPPPPSLSSKPHMKIDCTLYTLDN